MHTAIVGLEVYKTSALLAQSRYLETLTTYLKRIPVHRFTTDDFLGELECLLNLDSSLQIYTHGKLASGPEVSFVWCEQRTRIFVLGVSHVGADDFSYYDIFDLTAKEIAWLGDTAKSFLVFQLGRSSPGTQRTAAKAFLPVGKNVFRDDAYRLPKKIRDQMVAQFSQ